jgi:ammonium transporter, Amt family
MLTRSGDLELPGHFYATERGIAVPTTDTGNTGWVLISAALVLLMTPGLAFFYAGMVRPKNVIGILVQNYVTMAIVALVWVVVAYTLAFGRDVGGLGIIGNLKFAGLAHATHPVPGYTENLAQSIPPLAFIAFQLMFAVITPALVTGSIAERMKFIAFVLFVVVWSVLVYAPVAHWVFSPLGWLFERGAEDFAGGTVVHINAGAAGLALALVLGKRRGWPRAEMPQHNLPLVMVGAGLLWFGWFGFNAGSALGANTSAAYAFVNTNTAAAAGLLAWIITERARGGKPTALGIASGSVAGLVAITPAAGFVNPVGAIAIGLLAGIVCCLACSLKYRLGFDDALDVVGIHFFGGLVGALAIGFLGTSKVGGADGLFYGGGADLLVEQAIAVVVVAVYAFVATYLIVKVLDLLVGVRVSDEQEAEGLDLALHGEVAYDFGMGAGSLGGAATQAQIEADRITSRETERTGGHARDKPEVRDKAEAGHGRHSATP